MSEWRTRVARWLDPSLRTPEEADSSGIVAWEIVSVGVAERADGERTPILSFSPPECSDEDGVSKYPLKVESADWIGRTLLGVIGEGVAKGNWEYPEPAEMGDVNMEAEHNV